MSSSERPRTVLDKDEVLTGLFASWDAIDALLTGLSDEQWQTPTGLPGWTVQDVIAHVMGTEMMLSGSPVPESDADKAEHVRNQIGAINERWVNHMRDEPPAMMLTNFRAVTAQRKATLTATTPEDWNAVTLTPAGPDSFGRFMRVRTFDCWMHEHDIRDALATPVADDAYGRPDAQLALDEIESSMGFVVAKKGGAPDGSRVQLELTGPLARTIRVAVTGRAAVVPDFDGQDPTATITLDGRQFVRLCGGRPEVPEAAGPIDYDGDAEVGERIVQNLNYMI